MTTETTHIGEVLGLRRSPVAVDPSATYNEIGLRSFGKGVFHKEPVPGVELGDKRVFEICEGDLLLSNVFAWEGAIAVAGPNENGRIGSHRFMTYVPRDERVDISWMRFYLLSPKGMEQIRKASPGSAGRNRTLGIQSFESIEIQLPSIEEQRATARRLEQVSLTATNVLGRSERSMALSEALIVSAASRPDLTDDARVAAGWQRVRLGTVLTPARDLVRVEGTASYPNFGILSFGRGTFEKPPIEGSSTSATTLNRVRFGQFIYSRLFAFEGAYSSVPQRFDGWFVSGEFPTFDVQESALDARWLAAHLRSPERWSLLGAQGKGLGLRRQRVSAEAVLEFEVWLPPFSVQRKFLETAAIMDDLRTQQANSRRLAEALPKAALNEAFGC